MRLLLVSCQLAGVSDMDDVFALIIEELDFCAFVPGDAIMPHLENITDGDTDTRYEAAAILVSAAAAIMADGEGSSLADYPMTERTDLVDVAVSDEVWQATLEMQSLPGNITIH